MAGGVVSGGLRPGDIRLIDDCGAKIPAKLAEIYYDDLPLTKTSRHRSKAQ